MILKFDEFLYEKHGILTGEKSSSEFAKNIVDFMEYLESKNVGPSGYLIYGDDKILDERPDLKDVRNVWNWQLPKWADQTLVLLYKYFDDSSNDHAAFDMDYEFNCCEICVKSANMFKGNEMEKKGYIAVIKHEMKHYYDKMIDIKSNGDNKKNNVYYFNLSELDSKDKKKDEIFIKFNTFLYFICKTEMSAFIEQTYMRGFYKKNNIPFKSLKSTVGYRHTSKLLIRFIEEILTLKDNPSYKPETFELKDGMTYETIKNMIMKEFGELLENRFNKKMSFEKYLKEGVRYLTKARKKHSKAFFDAYSGVDYEDDEDLKKFEKGLERWERLKELKRKKGKEV